MNRHYFVWSLLLGCSAACVDSSPPGDSVQADPFGRGPYPVGSTNMEIVPEHANIRADAMHGYLLGQPYGGQPRFISDILRYPDSAWITNVQVPDERSLYGPASGTTLPVVTFLTFPSGADRQPSSYTFPYRDGMYGVFEDMLEPDENPVFADADERYPLILLAHGSSAHGIYDVRHAHNLSSHGYIVAVITYGDDRTAIADDPNNHVSFLRPFLTKAVLDSILESDVFGAHVDAENIGITGHSFGGFTGLAATGGAIQGNTASVTDERIKAASIAAPWVGGNYDGKDIFAFGPDNASLNRVKAPVLTFFGTSDELTLASFILPATRQLAGPTYVVELVDQPHIFEQESWEDRDNWELLFFSAYLKNNPESLAMLGSVRSMKGGNEDVQLFDYQKLTVSD